MEQIEDALDRNYRFTTRISISGEIGGEMTNASLFYKKIGTPSRMAFVVEYAHPKTGQLMIDPISSAPMRLRCAAAHALPMMLEAIKNEQLAAQTRLRDAVQSATAFLEKLS